MDVIQDYETKFTSILTNNRYKYEVYVDTTNFNFEHNNIATFYPDIFLKNGSPFLKIKSFRHFDHQDTF